MSISIRDLISLGDGRSVEFKQSLPPKSETYLKTVIAYANSWRQPHKAQKTSAFSLRLYTSTFVP